MPQKSPSTLRSPRNRALEIGASAAGFVPELPYNPQAGHPTGANYPSGEYAHELGHGTTEGGAQPIQTNPIKVK